jgi:hypothetical protein
MYADSVSGILNTMNKNTSEAVYGLGLIGAAVFYIQQSSTVVGVLVGLLKAVIWPALLVHKLLGA